MPAKHAKGREKKKERKEKKYYRRKQRERRWENGQVMGRDAEGRLGFVDGEVTNCLARCGPRTPYVVPYEEAMLPFIVFAGVPIPDGNLPGDTPALKTYVFSYVPFAAGF